MSSTGERIKALIKYYRKTQEEFAESIGNSKGYISLIVNDHEPITMGVLENILKSYPMVNLNWLLLGEGSMLRQSKADLSVDLVEKVIPLNPVVNVVEPLQELLARHEARIAVLEAEIAALKELLNQ